jgi:hypothetical protein
MAQFIGSNSFIIESDNHLVIDTMNDGAFSATSSAAIFDDCRIINSGFRDIKFQ